MCRKVLAYTIGIMSLCASAIAAPPNKQVQITGLNPINFTNLRPFGPGDVQEQTFCVYSASGNYNVTVTTSSPKGTLALPDPDMTSSKNTPFQIFWNNQANNNGSLQLINNQPTRFTGASTVAGCNGINNTYLRVVIPQASLVGIQSKKYQTLLKITVSWTN